MSIHEPPPTGSDLQGGDEAPRRVIRAELSPQRRADQRLSAEQALQHNGPRTGDRSRRSAQPPAAHTPTHQDPTGSPTDRAVSPALVDSSSVLSYALHREHEAVLGPARSGLHAVDQPVSPPRAERRLGRARRTVPPVFDEDPMGPEIYRQIYTSLELPMRATVTIIGVTSAIRGEGRTTIALGLAATLAIDLDVPVTLVEADLEHPSLAEVLHAEPGPGLAAVLRGEHQLFQVLGRLPGRFAPLSLIQAGWAGKNATPLLRRLATQDPFRGPKGLTGLVILDLPPVVTTSFGAMSATLADATVLVVRAGVTPHQLVREAITRLDARPPQGVVLNAHRTAIPRWWPGRKW